MPSILSELEPLKVWLKYIGPKTVCWKSWNFLSHVVAFCSQFQNTLLFLNAMDIKGDRAHQSYENDRSNGGTLDIIFHVAN